MKYENHTPPEGINSSLEHPFKEMALLLSGIAIIVILALLLINLFIGVIAKTIPYEYEEKLAALLVNQLTTTQTADETLAQQYLQQLANELASNMDLPEEIKITVHYSNDEVINAFATLGGHIFMYRGLIEKLPSENALSMVLGHEIAHIKHRHPMASIGQGLTVAIALATLSGVSGDALASTIGGVANLNNLRFSRKNEIQADYSSLLALHKKYGHIQGADQLFAVFLAIEDDQVLSPTEFFSTHPLSAKRIENIQDWATEQHWNTHGKPTDLPSIFNSPL